MIFKLIRNIFILLFIFICQCYSADVVFLDVFPEQSVARHQLDLICRFYGLNVKYLAVGNDENGCQLPDISKGNGIRAIMISERAFSAVDFEDLLRALPKAGEERIPILILGVTQETDSSLLSKWSNGAIIRCARDRVSSLEFLYKFSNEKILTRQLAGINIFFDSEGFDYFVLSRNHSAQIIIQIGIYNNTILFPIFIKTMVAGHEVFFLTQIQISECSDESIQKFNKEHFIKIAPFMMFLRYAFGEHCWHSPAHYANLTVDDPWLTEPYGHFSYKGLLEEMEKANFHTTIAFIPWNYDRNKPEVVSLFRKYPEKLSICIHGNNHDHREFYKYETNPGDPWPAKPMDVQEANIKQALARMAKFRNLTGLSYDKVMVFPHGIAPARTLGLLKKYNFLATVNADNVPLGSHEPADALFRLRPVTMKFENFPSLNRYTPRRIQSDIVIDLFLDNPILFYAHHDFFENSINVFNETADMLSNIQPDIVWQSLGYIYQHFYLEKLRDDGNYDIRAFSSNFILENTHQRDLTYFVQKEESFSFPIKQVTADGQLYPYKKSASDLVLELHIPAGESHHIVIEYENDLNLASVDISKNDPRVNRLRMLSDFRDITLSRNMVGRALIRIYYKTGLSKIGLRRLTIMLLILAIIVSFGTCYFIKRKKRKQLINAVFKKE